jgi:hypothetical protein
MKHWPRMYGAVQAKPGAGLNARGASGTSRPRAYCARACGLRLSCGPVGQMAVEHPQH